MTYCPWQLMVSLVGKCGCKAAGSYSIWFVFLITFSGGNFWCPCSLFSDIHIVKWGWRCVFFVVFQPSKCRNAQIQPQIRSIWPIYPNDSESLPKVCYIKRKNSEILSKLRNSEPAEVSALDFWRLFAFILGHSSTNHLKATTSKYT